MDRNGWSDCLTNFSMMKRPTMGLMGFRPSRRLPKPGSTHQGGTIIMGFRVEYRCPQCGYRVLAATGLDCGLSVTVKYVVCRPCCEVVPVVVARHFGQPRDSDGTCPRCQQQDFSDWIPDQCCPKCGTAMRQGEESLMWD